MEFSCTNPDRKCKSYSWIGTWSEHSICYLQLIGKNFDCLNNVEKVKKFTHELILLMPSSLVFMYLVHYLRIIHKKPYNFILILNLQLTHFQCDNPRCCFLWMLCSDNLCYMELGKIILALDCWSDVPTINIGMSHFLRYLQYDFL